MNTVVVVVVVAAYGEAPTAPEPFVEPKMVEASFISQATPPMIVGINSITSIECAMYLFSPVTIEAPFYRRSNGEVE